MCRPFWALGSSCDLTTQPEQGAANNVSVEPKQVSPGSFLPLLIPDVFFFIFKWSNWRFYSRCTWMFPGKCVTHLYTHLLWKLASIWPGKTTCYQPTTCNPMTFWCTCWRQGATRLWGLLNGRCGQHLLNKSALRRWNYVYHCLHKHFITFSFY